MSDQSEIDTAGVVILPMIQTARARDLDATAPTSKRLQDRSSPTMLLK